MLEILTNVLFCQIDGPKIQNLPIKGFVNTIDIVFILLEVLLP